MNPELLKAIIPPAMGVALGFTLGISVRPSEPPKPPTPTVGHISEDLQPESPQWPEREPLWADMPWFIPVMKAIAEMESSGGRNQRPNVDGIRGICQIEKPFYLDALEYFGYHNIISTTPTVFPDYEDLQGYDDKTFHASCIVAYHWFARYKANTPYLMFARFRKGPRGEKTETGKSYAAKALRIMNEKFSQNSDNSFDL